MEEQITIEIVEEVTEITIEVSESIDPSDFFRSQVVELEQGLNTVTFATEGFELPDTNYNIIVFAYNDNDDEIGYQIKWSLLTTSSFPIYVSKACYLRYIIVKHL